MTRPGQAHGHSDANQAEIVAALRRVGAKVYHIEWPVDLLVVFRGLVYLIEVKGPKGRLTAKQKELVREMAEAGYWPPVVRSIEEALTAIGADAGVQDNLPDAL